MGPIGYSSSLAASAQAWATHLQQTNGTTPIYHLRRTTPPLNVGDTLSHLHLPPPPRWYYYPCDYCPSDYYLCIIIALIVALILDMTGCKMMHSGDPGVGENLFWASAWSNGPAQSITNKQVDNPTPLGCYILTLPPTASWSTVQHTG